MVSVDTLPWDFVVLVAPDVAMGSAYHHLSLHPQLSVVSPDYEYAGEAEQHPNGVQKKGLCLPFPASTEATEALFEQLQQRPECSVLMLLRSPLEGARAHYNQKSHLSLSKSDEPSLPLPAVSEYYAQADNAFYQQYHFAKACLDLLPHATCLDFKNHSVQSTVSSMSRIYRALGVDDKFQSSLMDIDFDDMPSQVFRHYTAGLVIEGISLNLHLHYQGINPYVKTHKRIGHLPKAPHTRDVQFQAVPLVFYVEQSDLEPLTREQSQSLQEWVVPICQQAFELCMHRIKAHQKRLQKRGIEGLDKATKKQILHTLTPALAQVYRVSPQLERRWAA